MKKESNKEDAPLKEVTFRRLMFQALPEMWSFQVLAAVILALPAALLTRMISWIAGMGEDIVTTANIRSSVLSWRLPVILLLGILLVFLYLVMELFAQICLTDSILNGRRAALFKSIGRGILSLKKFMTPGGIGVILFIFIAVPLCGAGFSISLSKSFYIPNFIMEVVFKNPLFTAGYTAAIILLIWFAYRWVFVLHAVIIDGMTPKEGKKYSVRIVKEHRWEFLKRLILDGLVIFLIILVSGILFSSIPYLFLGDFGKDLPKGFTIDALSAFREGRTFSDLETDIMIYRTASAFAVLVEKYLLSIVTLLCGAYFMLRMNRYYLMFTGRDRELWPERPGKARYFWRILSIFLFFILLFMVAVAFGLFYNMIFTREEPVKIIAHRAGGTMASENSIEGLEKAIEHGCYGCEIDVQRTKDGYYVINHDNDFKRLTGVNRAPKDMTMEEIRELRIRDTTGNGQELSVVTLEEMLDVIKGRTKLFVELKGPTADRQMVDDVVRIIREHDCVEDTALISLDYGIIKYAETTYPEFETGTLFFASLGNISTLTCDLLIMEEETATTGNINIVHEGGKQAIVWTVNTRQGMYRFLDSNIDAIITDEILLAEEVQAMLDDRTDLEVLEDKLSFE